MKINTKIFIMNTKDFEILVKNLGLNQKEIAEKLGISENAICYWKKNDKIPYKYVIQLEKLLNNNQQTKDGSNVNGDKNSVNHDSHNTTYNYSGNEQMDGALCKFNEEQFTQIIELINSLNKHCAVKDSQIQFCTEQIQKLIRERDELRKELMEIYRTGKINRE